jgi:predicted phosphohydrolase
MGLIRESDQGMRVFAIGDMHLEGGTGKTMDRFGENWRNHDRKIFESWEEIGRNDDLLLIVGDTSWAMRLDEAMPDLQRIAKMKGTKILLKGNHDYWWESASKMSRVLDASIQIINANSLIINRVAIAGTRGWICPNDTYFKESDEKIYQREVGRLKDALRSLDSRTSEYDFLIIALHYPPTNDKHEPSGFTELIDSHGADACVYGHLHGDSIKTALTGMRNRTFHYLVSADAVDFSPREIQIMRSGD